MSDKDSHGKVSSLDPGPNGHIPIDYRGKFSVCPRNLFRNSSSTLIIDSNFSSHSLLYKKLISFLVSLDLGYKLFQTCQFPTLKTLIFATPYGPSPHWSRIRWVFLNGNCKKMQWFITIRHIRYKTDTNLIFGLKFLTGMICKEQVLEIIIIIKKTD